MILFVWAVFFSPWLQIKNIEVIGTDPEKSALILDSAWMQTRNYSYLILPQKNILLFDDKELINHVSSNTQIKNLKVNKKFPNNLIISFDKKDYAIVWKEGGGKYFLDNTGAVISEASDQDIYDKKLPILSNLSQTRINNGQTILDEEMIRFATDLDNEFKNPKFGLTLEEIIIDSESDTMKVKASSSPQIYFNTKTDIYDQLNKLLIIKNDNLKLDFFKKTYIDLRFGDKIYYK